MAEENTRPARGRKKAGEIAGGDDHAGERDSSKVTGPKGAKAAAKRTAEKAGTVPAPAKKTAAKQVKKPGVRRARKTVAAPDPAREAVAERAYLLWERGEPGDQTEHWLRAEAELRAA